MSVFPSSLTLPFSSQHVVEFHLGDRRHDDPPGDDGRTRNSVI
jgi:hypothetical protein